MAAIRAKNSVTDLMLISVTYVLYTKAVFVGLTALLP